MALAEARRRVRGLNIPIWSHWRRSGHFSQYDAFAMRRGSPEGLAGKPQNGDRTMPFRARVVASAALGTASFLLAPLALAAGSRSSAKPSPRAVLARAVAGSALASRRI